MVHQPRLLTLLLLASVQMAPTAHAQPVSAERIEARAACITHEGADVPVAAAARKSAGAPAPPEQKDCAKAVLDGTVCGSLDGAAERQCLSHEIAIWDGVLDRLVRESAERKDRQASLRGAIAAFRSFRDKACATYQKVAINPAGAAAVTSCRVNESARFAQDLYIHVYSP